MHGNSLSGSGGPIAFPSAPYPLPWSPPLFFAAFRPPAREADPPRTSPKHHEKIKTMKIPKLLHRWNSGLSTAALALIFASLGVSDALAQAKKPNILVIFGDDIGQTNISAYSHGVMGYKTPNIDRIAREGMMFTDYYAGRVARPVAHRSSPARQVCGPA